MNHTKTSYEHLGINSDLLPMMSPVRDMVKNPVTTAPIGVRDIAQKRRIAQRNSKGRWREPHNTIMTSKSVPVDSRIAPLIEALWKIGIETQFSCEGNLELFDESGTLENMTDASHIVFPKMETAIIFMERSYQFLIHSRPDLQWSNLVNLEPMLPTKDIHNVRAIVRFNPAAMASLTAYWKSSLTSI